MVGENFAKCSLDICFSLEWLRYINDLISGIEISASGDLTKFQHQPCASIAQWLERWSSKLEVGSSILPGGEIFAIHPDVKNQS